MVIIVSVAFTGFSQTKNSDINAAFENYTKNFQEVVHVHLNKSSFVVGEDIGFTAYVFNKNDKSLSKETENLYCVITDENDKIIKSQLLKVTNGIASGTFKLDDDLASSNYTFKAYTNWMRNFKHNNTFVENFKIINPKKPKKYQRFLEVIL
ncbi:MAG: hypothetical protein HC798_01535 [Polaribacter sp.]|nr:hypothetical protein [Polaribacter sp.]